MPQEVQNAQNLTELDQMQRNFKAAVDAWVAAIRYEEALASVTHDVAEIDEWEGAALRAEAAGKRASAAKKAYEDALREKFFKF
jgi:hypothetical protein